LIKIKPKYNDNDAVGSILQSPQQTRN